MPSATVEQANATCRQLLGIEHRQRHDRDHRITEWLDQKLRLASLAGAINVSESWLAHRFTGEVGIPIRRYILWQRLFHAVELALRGARLTYAAHTAGLSDAAHLSRAFRETLGVMPVVPFRASRSTGGFVCCSLPVHFVRYTVS